eukprot:COSAG01_NODE_8720_length_2684_cov_3.235886_2_plen_307_part_00
MGAWSSLGAVATRPGGLQSTHKIFATQRTLQGSSSRTRWNASKDLGSGKGDKRRGNRAGGHCAIDKKLTFATPRVLIVCALAVLCRGRPGPGRDAAFSGLAAAVASVVHRPGSSSPAARDADLGSMCGRHGAVVSVGQWQWSPARPRSQHRSLPGIPWHCPCFWLGATARARRLQLLRRGAALGVSGRRVTLPRCIQHSSSSSWAGVRAGVRQAALRPPDACRVLAVRSAQLAGAHPTGDATCRAWHRSDCKGRTSCVAAAGYVSRGWQQGVPVRWQCDGAPPPLLSCHAFRRRSELSTAAQHPSL